MILRRPPQEFLVVLGLSNVWDDNYFKLVIENATGMIIREPMYDGITTDQPTFTQVTGDCIRAPAALDDVLPRLTSKQVIATMPDPKSRSKGKDMSSLAPQSSGQKTRDSSRTLRARKGASKNRKLAVNDEHEIIRTRDKEEKFGPSRMFGLTDVVRTSRNSVPLES
ncbi:hypothetical protein Tco_1529385 [Tanacetum coccineum]